MVIFEKRILLFFIYDSFHLVIKHMITMQVFEILEDIFNFDILDTSFEMSTFLLLLVLFLI